MLQKKWYLYHQLENISAMKYLNVPKAIDAWNAIQPLPVRLQDQLRHRQPAVRKQDRKQISIAQACR